MPISKYNNTGELGFQYNELLGDRNIQSITEGKKIKEKPSNE